MVEAHDARAAEQNEIALDGMEPSHTISSMEAMQLKKGNW
jgi:hypothetical protein